ncbi:hypothetical protein BIZ35_09505 [Heyndrickxia coagulans]|nr:hypothetical protein BIZ35_09505 [Heyndrickxia coagulans]
MPYLKPLGKWWEGSSLKLTARDFHTTWISITCMGNIMTDLMNLAGNKPNIPFPVSIHSHSVSNPSVTGAPKWQEIDGVICPEIDGIVVN